MANLLLTSFFGITDAQINRRPRILGNSWVGGALTFQATGSRWGGPAMLVGSGYEISFITLGTDAGYLGMAIKQNSGSPNNGEFLYVQAPDASNIATLTWASGRIEVRNANATLIGTSTTTVTSQTIYLEIGVSAVASSATLSLRINGAVEVTATTDTQPGSQTQVERFRLRGNNSNPYVISDVYLNDGTGSAPHNGFYGDVRVSAPTTAADSAVQFTPLSGGNESNIDDGNTPDDATSYNSSGTVGHRDLFTISGFSGSGILAACTRVVAAKDDAGGRSIAPVIKSGSTSSVGSSFALSTNYLETAHTTVTDPATGVAFANAAAINALTVGYEVSA